MRASRAAVVLAAAALLLAGCSGDPTTTAPSPSGVAGEASPQLPSPTRPLPSEVPSALRPDQVPPTDDSLLADVEAELERQEQAGDDLVLGADASWPQCPRGMGIPEKRSSGAPPPLPQARFVILGLTNGPGFYPNPCLADQVATARAQGQLLGAYAVASYPEARFLEQYADDGPYDGSSRLGALANVGYQQALFNLRTMRAAALTAPTVWIDVEPVPDFAWSSDTTANAAVVGGLARGYREAGLSIGVYSTPYLWDGVVGGLELGVPEWRAAGQTSRAEALERCGDDWVIQGGPAAIGQWVEDGRDQNITCPGAAVDLDRWFTA